MRRVLIAALLLSSSILAGGPAAALVDDFAISVPGEPLQAKPGDTVDTSIRVVNRSMQTTRYTLKAVALEAHDQGRLEIVEGSDSWTASAKLADAVDIEGGSFTDVPVSLVVPPDATPNIYLVGLAVQPLRAAEGSLDVRAAAANHVAIEVPGPVRRSIALAKHTIPRFVISSELKGRFDAVNDGEATVRYRAQVRIDSALSDENLGVVQATSASSPDLLPQGRTKTLPYRWTLSGPAAILHPTAEINLVDGENGIRQAGGKQSTVVMIHPVTAAVIGAFVVVLVGGFGGRAVARRVRKRSANRRVH